MTGKSPFVRLPASNRVMRGLFHERPNSSHSISQYRCKRFFRKDSIDKCAYIHLYSNFIWQVSFAGYVTRKLTQYYSTLTFLSYDNIKAIISPLCFTTTVNVIIIKAINAMWKSAIDIVAYLAKAKNTLHGQPSSVGNRWRNFIQVTQNQLRKH